MELFAGLLGLIPSVIVLVATITLNSKRPGSEVTMMLVGSSLSVVVSFFYSVGLPLLTRSGDNGISSISQYFGTVSILGTVGGFLFAIGLLLFVQKQVSKK